MNDHLLTVIIRLHATTPEAMSQFDSALFSVAGSTYEPVETLIVTQEFSDAQVDCVRSIVEGFVWPGSSIHRVVNLTGAGPGDHRSALLNLGLREARGRYVAFLDYDDRVYEHAYETLIGRLRECSSAAAFGGCIAAHTEFLPNGESRVASKTCEWEDCSDEAFLADNTFPIHSFVLDRARLGATLPRFNESLTRLEDFEFLLRLRMVTTFDRHYQRQPLVEYTIRAGTPRAAPFHSIEERRQWTAARAVIEPLKSEVALTIGLPANA